MIHYSNELIIDSKIHLSSNNDHHYLGPSLILRNCEINMSISSTNLTISDVLFDNCSINIRKKLNNFIWCNSYITNTKFIGNLSGCDFGSWPQYYNHKGGLDKCDFSQSKLDGCRFINVDITTLDFPTWPFFTIVKPKSYLSIINRSTHNIPNNALNFINSFSYYPDETSAVSFNSSSIEKRWGFDVNEIKDFVETKDYFI